MHGKLWSIDRLDRRTFLTGAAGLTLLDGVGARPLASAFPAHVATPVVSTDCGKLRGMASNGVLFFKGVPYAGPADGSHRFLPPGKPVPWKGVRDATTAGPRAVQSPKDKGIFADPLLGSYFSGGRSDGPQITYQPDSENCLVLNVLTSALHGRSPVMVYIHGGGFSAGSGALTLLSDRFVAEQNVVLVGINHRLNAFGYTYLADLDHRFPDSGNIGQLDLIAALQWVKRNIAAFGGDPSNVTIFGESGGGAKISTLLAMPSAQGLFHRAIIESGSLREARTRDAANADTRKFLSQLGLDVKQIDRLQTLPADKLFAAYQAAPPGLSGPVLDGRSLPHQTWVPTAPPEAAGISLIVGNCQDESTLFSQKNPALFSLDWQSLKTHSIQAGIAPAAIDAIISRYRHAYPSDSPSDLYFRISSDRGARRNAMAQASAKLNQGQGQVYMYYFAWNTPLGGGRFRAFHTAELPLAMRLVRYPESEQLSRQISGAWAAFARHGNPNHDGLPDWSPYSRTRQSTMVFNAGGKTALVDNPAQAELALLKPYPGGIL